MVYGFPIILLNTFLIENLNETAPFLKKYLTNLILYDMIYML